VGAPANFLDSLARNMILGHLVQSVFNRKPKFNTLPYLGDILEETVEML
jgi:hypothetical protein